MWPAQGGTVSVRYSLRGGATMKLHLEAWDADVGLRDDLIGQVSCNPLHGVVFAVRCALCCP